ncbi:MAG: MarR family winged helix-turn-helix transcriptional regulator [Acidocella sp.]|nr:MarR family winged helix-turn-helix transcriptional regulator [Acidocella sp.]
MTTITHPIQRPPSKPNNRPFKRSVGATLRGALRAYNQALQQQLIPFKLNLQQFLHLRFIWEIEGLTQNEISQLVGVEKASSTVVFNTLEAKKLITRTRSAADRRKVHITLTAAGRALQDAVRPSAQRVAQIALADVDKTHVDIFINVLEKIITNLSPPTTAIVKKKITP